MLSRRIAIVLLLLPAGLVASPLFDVHLHYNSHDAAHYSPQQIVALLERHNIQQAVVTSTPASHSETLYRHAPQRIVPLLGVYRVDEDKLSWTDDTSLPARIEVQLTKGFWRGIGELHIFAKDRHRPVFKQIVALAVQHRLPLQIHGDPAVIDSIYDMAPGHPVLWAHAGTFPYPDLLADYLQRYPALRVDVSVRDERIAPNGTIRDDWYRLFVRFPDRFMVGVDTFSLSRWQQLDSVISSIRHWLDQLPQDVAQQLAYENAAAMFTVKSAP